MAPTNELTRLQRITYRVWLGVGVVLLSAVALYVLARPLAVVVPPLLVALILVYILNPVVGLLQRIKVPRLLGTLLSIALFIGAIVGVGALVGPPLGEQLSMFAEELPEFGEQITVNVILWLIGLGVDVDTVALDAEALATEVQDFLGDAESRAALLGVLGGLSGLATGVFNLVLALFVGPFVAAYLLWDLPRVRVWVQRLIPPHNRAEVDAVGRRLSDVVGGYIRGQLIVATYVGVATSIGLAIVGLPFWLVIGAVAGVTNLVPLVGPFVGGALGASVALMTDGVGLALIVVAVITIVQQGDAQIVSPLVMGRTVRLHPLVVLLALLVGGTLYGIFGLIVAVPLVAAANVLVGHMWETRVPWANEGDVEMPPADSPDDPGLVDEPGLPEDALSAGVSGTEDPGAVPGAVAESEQPDGVARTGSTAERRS